MKRNKITKKCVYKRESRIEQYTPECCIEYDPAFNDWIHLASVHSEDCVNDWVFCPYCGNQISYSDEDEYNDS